HAGAAGHRRRTGSPGARAVPRARHLEPDRAGGYLSAARSAARPLPPAGQRRLSGRGRRAAHDDRDHGRRHPPGAAGDDGAGAVAGAGPAAARAGRRARGRRHPAAGARRAAVGRSQPRDRGAGRLGTGSARQPGADARGARPRPAPGPPRALGRRRRRAGAAGAAPPHGAHLHRPRRGRHVGSGDPAVVRRSGLMAQAGVASGSRLTGLHQQAEALADRLPPLLVAAERVAATIAQGVHGRRRVGTGETFWQFRPYQPGDATARIDWRQSARSSQLFLRDQEWEAAESVWLWADTSGSMAYSSTPRLPSKEDRALLLLLALASLLTRAGERIALLGDQRRPIGGRAAVASLCDRMSAHPTASVVPIQPLPRYARLVLISDFFVPLEDLRERLRKFVAMGIRGHLLQVLDPAEPVL